MALDFVAGCIGGCAGVIVGHPLDTIKVHLQTQDAKNPKFTGTVDCFRKLVTKDGLRGLYRGMTSPLAGVAAINAIVFGVYGNTQRSLNPETLQSSLIAGATAGFFQSFLCSPMELAKSRLQVAKSPSGPLDCLRKIYRGEGVRGLFRGLNSTILREIPAFGSYFLTYEFLTRSDDNRPVSTGNMLLAGGISGMVSWIIVYPIDVVKSRFQIDNTYKNSLDCLRKSVSSEGYNFLYKGLSPTLLRAFPVNAATFAVVTWTVRLYEGDLWGRCSDAVYTLKVSEAVPV
ncbi:mitochondrial basic amino acids transporter [Tribolium madens]|uniref:mitochondrial basic amino acids transporter n=1 Tax=Tribolium madens TaxID=41895 RepID=UPI001CF73E52|nr:mitochondrial basic amino acids transporter [Tribolium madens]XP_044267258.1 mitochondrial basic amino acids transporter [Tribolium madens]